MSVTIVVLLVTGLVAVLWTQERVIARTDVGLAVALTVVMLDLLGAPLEVSVGSLRITDLDLVFGLLGVAAVARLIRAPALDPLQWLLLGSLALVAASIANGVPEFGVGTAINEARTHLRFAGAALYFSTIDGNHDRFDRLAMTWFVFAGALLVLTVARWVGFATGIRGVWWMGGADDLRVIDSFSTLVLLQVLLVVWGARQPVPRWVSAAGPVLLAVVVLLQHRTLWIALAVGALVWSVRDRRIAARLVPAFLLAIVAGGVMAFTIFGDPTSIREQLETSATNADTFEWRIEGWRQLVFSTGPDEPVEVTFGLPFGSGYDRRVAGQTVSVTPHNFFVETYLRTGVTGVLMLVLLFVMPIRRLRQRVGWGRYLHADTLLTVMVTQLLFVQTSHPSPEQGILVGLALATAARGPRTEPSRHTTAPRRQRPEPRSASTPVGAEAW